MSQKHSFRAVIEDAGSGGAYITVPFDVEQVFGKKRVKVKALIAGEPYRGSLVRMGGDCHILGIRKEIREKTGKAIGDEIEITLEEDLDPRIVILPEELQNALSSNLAARSAFDQLSYSHQKEYVEWITEAKRQETRQKRIDQLIKQLEETKEEG